MQPKKIKFIVSVIAVFLFLGFAKNMIVQAAIAGSISAAAHVPVEISKTSAMLSSSSIRLGGFRALNPNGFPEKVMLDVPSIWVQYDPPSFFKGQAHFKEVGIDLRELRVIKNRDGKLNIDSVKPTREENEKRRKAAETSQANRKPMKLKIDKLTLSIGRVVYVDYSVGGSPQTQVFEIGIRDRLFTNVEDATTLVNLVMFEALRRTTLSRILNMDLSLFKNGAFGAFDEGMNLFSGSSQKVEDTAKNLLQLFN